MKLYEIGQELIAGEPVDTVTSAVIVNFEKLMLQGDPIVVAYVHQTYTDGSKETVTCFPSVLAYYDKNYR